MLASLGSGAGLRSVEQVSLVPDDLPAARRLDAAVAAFLSGDSGSCSRPRSRSRSGAPATATASGPVPLPAGFGSLPPGPRLAAALADVPVRRVSGYDTVEVMTAAHRQACHAQAVFLRALLETGMRQALSHDGVFRVASPGEFAAEEARAALVWSRRRADSTFEFAWQVFERLPMLGEAMEAGVLDEPRARAFVQWTIGLDDDQAAQVITGLLPGAGTLLVGALIDRIKRAAIAIDPGWAERRYRAAVKGRRVEGSRNDDGTANLHGLDLPIDRAAAACDRIDTLARACKHAGDARPIDHIRADLYLGMLDGSFERFTDDQIVDHVLAHPFVDLPAPGTTTGGHNSDADNRGGSDADSRGDGHNGDAENRDGGGDGSRPPAETGPDRRAADGTVTAGTTDTAVTPGPGGPATAGPAPGGWRVGELRVEVAAMLGLNEHPAEIVGWDFVPAALARPLLATMSGAQWRWVVCDHDGHPISTGITRRRPASPADTEPPVRNGSSSRHGAGIVELQLQASELPHLIAAGHPLGWDTVLADIADQHAATVAADPIGAPGTDGAAGSAADADRRSARVALRRAVQVRDRSCTHPACRAPASRTDQDHAVDHADGGPTDAANLGCCCRHDHRLKHDGGWQLTRTAPDLAVWTSPLGHSYANRPPPVMPPSPRSRVSADRVVQFAPGRSLTVPPADDAEELPAPEGSYTREPPPF